MNNKKQMGADVVATIPNGILLFKLFNRLTVWLSYIWIIIQWHFQVILAAGKYSAYLGRCDARVTPRVNNSEHKYKL